MNTKAYILRNVGNQTVSGPIECHSTFFFHTMEVNGEKILPKYLPLCLKEERTSSRFWTTWG